jgi:hypothetical protein
MHRKASVFFDWGTKKAEPESASKAKFFDFAANNDADHDSSSSSGLNIGAVMRKVKAPSHRGSDIGADDPYKSLGKDHIIDPIRTIFRTPAVENEFLAEQCGENRVRLISSIVFHMLAVVHQWAIVHFYSGGGGGGSGPGKIMDAADWVLVWHWVATWLASIGILAAAAGASSASDPARIRLACLALAVVRTAHLAAGAVAAALRPTARDWLFDFTAGVLLIGTWVTGQSTCYTYFQIILAIVCYCLAASVGAGFPPPGTGAGLAAICLAVVRQIISTNIITTSQDINENSVVFATSSICSILFGSLIMPHIPQVGITRAANAAHREQVQKLLQKLG